MDRVAGGRNMKRWGIVLSAVAVMCAWSREADAALPPGRPYVLTIKGDNTVTFVPETGLAPLPIDYKARVEYLVNSRRIEPGSAKGAAARKPAGRRRSSGARRVPKKSDDDAPRAAGAVDLAIHSAEMTFRRNEQVVVQARVSRARFQGRFLPDAPILSVSYYQAPPALQEVLKTFDTTAASILIDDRAIVVARRVRGEGPLHAIIETLLSIHTPIPTDMAFWEARRSSRWATARRPGARSASRRRRRRWRRPEASSRSRSPASSRPRARSSAGSSRTGPMR